jgi:hypothetical protein
LLNMLVVRLGIFGKLLLLMGEVGVLLELVQRGVANDAAGHGLVAFERMVARTISAGSDRAVIGVVALGHRELIGLAGLLHGRAGSKQQRIGAANRVGVEAQPAGDAAPIAASHSPGTP